MSNSKETRKQIMKSGSPLRHHSLNQTKLKVGDQGEIRVKNTYSLDVTDDDNQNSKLNHREIFEEILTSNLPLAREFLEKMLPIMIEIASKRILEEETKQSTIPIRIFRLATDVQKIYRLSQPEKLHLQMVDHSKFAVEGEGNFYVVPVSLDHIRYPHIFNHLQYLNVLYKIKSQKSHLPLYRSLISNLTSCDFSLPYRDQIIERIKVYSFVMAGLALAIYPDPSDEKLNTFRLNTMFLELLEEIKAPLLKQ